MVKITPRCAKWVTWGLLFALLAVSAVTIYLLISNRQEFEQRFQSVISTEIQKQVSDTIKQIPAPKNGVNGLDGKDGVTRVVHDYTKTTITLPGVKGDTGESAYQVWLDLGNVGTEQDFIDFLKGDTGDNGLTPILRCNQVKNQWEYRYNEYEAWQLVNNEIVSCLGVQSSE